MVQNGDNTDGGGTVTTPRVCRGLGKACQLQQDLDLALEPKLPRAEGQTHPGCHRGKLGTEPRLHRKGSGHSGPGKQRPQAHLMKKKPAEPCTDPSFPLGDTGSSSELLGTGSTWRHLSLIPVS